MGGNRGDKKKGGMLRRTIKANNGKKGGKRDGNGKKREGQVSKFLPGLTDAGWLVWAAWERDRMVNSRTLQKIRRFKN
jgi:hypothetical protein